MNKNNAPATADTVARVHAAGYAAYVHGTHLVPHVPFIVAPNYARAYRAGSNAALDSDRT